MQTAALRIGTRGSPLALAQAEETARRLGAIGIPRQAIDIVVIKTTGDVVTDRPLGEAGGKGLFAKEIEEALFAGTIDVGVHSAKDMPTVLPPGLHLAGYLPREDVRDAFISPAAASLVELPDGAVLGTSSLRRRAMALRQRPDLRPVEFRGNVQTRLRKLAEGVAHATLLALAGLKRLAMDDRVTAILDPEIFVPAAGQGAITLEIRDGDRATADRVAPILDATTAPVVGAERAFLGALDGSCRTPIGGYATIDARGELSFHGLIISPDGREAHETRRKGSAVDFERLGRDAGEELKRRGGPRFFG
ncbi:MAG: hydroxymethylbilane synthase [Bauldia sp.]